MKNNKKAISLIVLVITIIVMIILATAIILTLNSDGIINKANQAVDASDEAEVKNLVSLAWSETYIKGISEDLDDTKEYIIESLKDAGLTDQQIAEYGIIVTKEGVTVNKGWTQVGLQVVKGDMELTVGDTITYDETKGGTITDVKDVNWQVLGANEDGELLILSTEYVKDSHILGGATLAEAQTSYIEAAADLDEICAVYGAGENAVKARSITVEDMNRITTYDITSYYPKPISEYGLTVTFYWDGTAKPAYTSRTGNGSITLDHENFIWYNAKEKAWASSPKATITDGTKQPIKATIETANGQSKEVTATITTNFYTYDASEYCDWASDAYELVFGRDGLKKYWAASPYEQIGSSRIYYGYWFVSYGLVNGQGLLISDGTPYERDAAVRAVVHLKSDLKLVPGTTEDWKAE